MLGKSRFLCGDGDAGAIRQIASNAGKANLFDMVRSILAPWPVGTVECKPRGAGERGEWSLADLDSKPRSFVWTGCPMFAERTWADHDGPQPIRTLLVYSEENKGEARALAHGVRALEEIRLRPMYAEANTGTRPRRRASVVCSIAATPANFTKLATPERLPDSLVRAGLAG